MSLDECAGHLIRSKCPQPHERTCSIHPIPVNDIQGESLIELLYDFIGDIEKDVHAPRKVERERQEWFPLNHLFP